MSRERLFFLFTKYLKIRVNSVNSWFFTEDGRTRTDEKTSNSGWLGGEVRTSEAAATWGQATRATTERSRRNVDGKRQNRFNDFLFFFAVFWSFFDKKRLILLKIGTKAQKTRYGH